MDRSAGWMKMAAALCLSAGGAAGCATIDNPATQRRETVLSSSVEAALGELARAQMGLRGLRVGRVPQDQLARVQGIGGRLAQVSDRQDVAYRFGVVQEKSKNAFTLPGGTIYVHTGILEAADDEELASVIAHEVGHVAARHVAKHLQADLGFAVLLHIAQAAGAGAESARLADSLYGLFRNGFSRRDELEADRLGLRYLLRAGYNPHGMIRFFEKMLAEEPGDRAFSWQSTHPLVSERIDHARREIARLEGMRFCPACGREYSPPERFCERDGQPLKERVFREGAR